MQTLAFRQSKPQQQPYLDTRVTESQRRAPKKRSQRARERLETKKRLVALSTEIGERELAGKIQQCHAFVSVLTCGRCISRIIPNATCEFRLCPDCSRRRSRKILNKHLPTMRAFVQGNRVTPVHLVLTQAHRQESRKASVKRLRNAFTKLQRRAFWKEYFKGGTWSLEFTKDKQGLHHTHFHIIGFRSRFFDIELLRDEWKAVTGDSHVLHLKPIEDLTAGLLEVVKYVSKPVDIKRFTGADLRDFLKLKNCPLFGTFGEYRKFSRNFTPLEDDNFALSTDLESLSRDLVEGCACPHCNEPLFEIRLSAEGFPIFLEGIESSPPRV